MTHCRLPWPAPLLSTVLALPLLLTACSSDDAEPTTPTTSGDASPDDRRAGAPVPDITLPGAPEGFTVTSPGTVLSVGEPASVATRAETYDDQPHGLQFWRVTAQPSHDVPAGDIALENTDAAEIDHFVCINYDVEFLGWDTASGIGGDTQVARPTMSPVDGNGQRANFVVMGGDNECGVDEADRLPFDATALEQGRIYRGAALSYVTTDGSGISPAGAMFSFGLDVAPELSASDNICWH